MIKRTSILAVGFCFSASLMASTVYIVRVTDSGSEGNPLQQDGEIQAVAYIAGNTGGNFESRKGGPVALLPQDDRSTLVQSYSDTQIVVWVFSEYFGIQPADGDLIQSVVYWMSDDQLHLSFDSLVHDPIYAFVHLGLNDTVVVERPQLRASGSSVLVRWASLPDPVVHYEGIGPAVPGAVESWNVYRAVGRASAEHVEFVENVANDGGVLSIVDYPLSVKGRLYYGVVPVFRSSGEKLGPQETGIELRRAPKTSLGLPVPVPVLTFSPPLRAEEWPF